MAATFEQGPLIIKANKVNWEADGTLSAEFFHGDLRVEALNQGLNLASRSGRQIIRVVFNDVPEGYTERSVAFEPPIVNEDTVITHPTKPHLSMNMTGLYLAYNENTLAFGVQHARILSTLIANAGTSFTPTRLFESAISADHSRTTQPNRLVSALVYQIRKKLGNKGVPANEVIMPLGNPSKRYTCPL